MKHILKCPVCNTYTMKEHCSKCSSKTINPKPAKFSPKDAYGEYRRKVKKDEFKRLNLI